MGRQEFCLQRGLALVTLDRYRSRHRKAPAEPSGEGRFVAVELKGGPAGAQSGLAVVLNRGQRIEVASGLYSLHASESSSNLLPG